MNNSEYRELVLGIYHAVSEPEAWQRVLDRISDRVSASGAILYEWHRIGNRRHLEIPLMSSNFDRATVEDYFRRHRKEEERDHDAFDRRLLETDGIDLLSEDILYEDYSSYAQRPHVVELQEHGIRYRTGSLLDKDNPYRARLSFAMSERRGPLDDADVALLRDLLPHLSKALDLSRPMGTPGKVQGVLSSVIDRLRIGVCILDRWGRKVMSNLEFDRQVHEFRSIRQDMHGKLKLANPADQRSFEILLDDALNHGKFGARPRKEAIVLEIGDAGTSLCIEVVPVDALDDIGSHFSDGAMVLSRDTSWAIDIDVRLARRAFSLTSTEAAVVDLVCQGLSNPQIAAQRERSVETVNAQMKSILGKTRAANRTQLVRLLCNFSLPVGYAQK